MFNFRQVGFVGGVEGACAEDKFEYDIVVFGLEGGRVAKEDGEEEQAWIGYIGFKAVSRFGGVEVKEESAVDDGFDSFNSIVVLPGSLYLI